MVQKESGMSANGIPVMGMGGGGYEWDSGDVRYKWDSPGLEKKIENALSAQLHVLFVVTLMTLKTFVHVF